MSERERVEAFMTKILLHQCNEAEAAANVRKLSGWYARGINKRFEELTDEDFLSMDGAFTDGMFIHLHRRGSLDEQVTNLGRALQSAGERHLAERRR